VNEPGSEAIDALYREAEHGEAIIVFSVWNIGEVFGVIDRKERLGQITKGGAASVVKGMIGESLKMCRMNALRIVPLSLNTLSEAWQLILKHHIYVADAIQISTAKNAEVDLFYSYDKHLNEIAEKEQLKIKIE
jgi:predicted nucleic acid-binding protein